MKTRRWLRRLALGLGVLAVSWVGIGAGLTATPEPRFERAPRQHPAPPGAGMSGAQGLAAAGEGASRLTSTEATRAHASEFLTPAGAARLDSTEATGRTFRARDGVALAARAVAGTGVTVLWLHGVTGSSAELESGARLLHELTAAEVICLDLRGHGRSGGAPGDVAGIGQYDDDVADVVAALRAEQPQRRIVLAGHSMGGGIALRYADRREREGVDGYLLFAPLVGYDSPTMRKEEAAGTGEPAVKLHVSRLLGLIMLNTVGITWANALNVLHFNLPSGRSPAHYTYRATVSMTPPDYRRALQADSKPMLVLVGRHDEAFHAEAFPGVAALHPSGQALIVEGEGHDSIVTSRAAAEAVRDWLRRP